MPVTTQPLTIEVDEENDCIRKDINSCEMKSIFPTLPDSNNWSKHRQYVKKREQLMIFHDSIAYEKIKHNFPNFRPNKLKTITYYQRIKERWKNFFMHVKNKSDV